MELNRHNFRTLFMQLGLSDNDQSIANFIENHRSLPANIPLEQAGFWNASQAMFLREAVQLDSDWAEVVDQLNQALRD